MIADPMKGPIWADPSAADHIWESTMNDPRIPKFSVWREGCDNFRELRHYFNPAVRDKHPRQQFGTERRTSRSWGPERLR